MRIDQLQTYLSQRGLIHAVAYHLGYSHLDWISKDTDMQANHWQKHTISWPVPEGPYDLDGWAKDLATALEGEAAFTQYNPTLNDNKGIFLVYGYRIHENKNTSSGWNVVFEYTYVDPTMALM